MEDQQYQIKLANHAIFFRAQREVASRLEVAILARYYDKEDKRPLDIIVYEEVKRELENLYKAEAISIPYVSNKD